MSLFSSIFVIKLISSFFDYFLHSVVLFDVKFCTVQRYLWFGMIVNVGIKLIYYETPTWILTHFLGGYFERLNDTIRTKYEMRRSVARRGQRRKSNVCFNLRADRYTFIILRMKLSFWTNLMFSNESFLYSQIRYPCRNCGKMYKHRGNLHRHTKFECGNIALFSCQFCGRKFSQYCNLTRHISSQHAEVTVKGRWEWH